LYIYLLNIFGSSTHFHNRLWREEAVVRSVVFVALIATMAIAGCSKLESPTSPSTEVVQPPTASTRVLVNDFTYRFSLDPGTAEKPSSGVSVQINFSKYPADRGRFEVEVAIDQPGQVDLLASTVQYNLSTKTSTWLVPERIGVDRQYTWTVPGFPPEPGDYGVGLKRLTSPIALTGAMKIYYIPN
jgi:hypothetical protein